MTKLFYFFIIGFSLFPNIFAQKYLKNYFSSPLNIPIFLSGTFGELRGGHFHAGIDFKTGGRVGIPIRAAADGYVSRIKIQEAGYGKTLYIQHPNGYTTVYAHMKEFDQKVEEYVKNYQYQNETYTLNIFPQKNKFLFEKGEVIGLSGTSGYSFGPHLHFEIRDKNQVPLNGMGFGFDIKDNVKPDIKKIAIYPLDDRAYINSNNKTLYLNAKGENGKFVVNDKNISVSGNIGFGIETYDYLNGSHNRCGVYSIELFVNEELIYSHYIDEISFSRTRFINALLDYPDYVLNGNKIQRSYILPYNKLDIYKNVKNMGVINFNDSSMNNIKYIVKDFLSNTSSIEFKVNSTLKKEKTSIKRDVGEHELRYNKPLKIVNEKIEVYIPSHAVYNDMFVDFEIESSMVFDSNFSVLKFHENIYPLHKRATITFKGLSLNEKNRDQLVVIRKKKDEWHSVGGKLEGNKITANVREFGYYSVTVDSVLPEIKALNISEGKDMNNEAKIAFEVTDNLSGINSYEGYIDGEWVLFEYDYKNDLVQYYFDDERIEKGKLHDFEIYITDGAGNFNVFTSTFYY